MIGVLFCRNGARWIMMSLVDMVGFPTGSISGRKNTCFCRELLTFAMGRDPPMGFLCREASIENVESCSSCIVIMLDNR